MNTKKTSKVMPKPLVDESPLEYSTRVSNWYNTQNQERIKGQIFTPMKLAQYMATSLPPKLTIRRILDPGVGTASLSCALVERMASFRRKYPIEIHAVEIDTQVSKMASQVLNHAKTWANRKGIELDFMVYNEDFIDFGLSRIGLEKTEYELEPYDLVIMNPPYYKLRTGDLAVDKSEKLLVGNTNMYTLFISLATQLIRKGGCIVSVNPRSFLSGKSFEGFRRNFFSIISPYRIHRFISREEVFSEANVLQEIIIIAGVRNGTLPNQVSILSSNGTTDIDTRTSLSASMKTILSDNSDRRLALPLEESDLVLLDEVKNWKSNLGKLGIDISTGPVVPFRSENLTRNIADDDAVPLLWMQNVDSLSIRWPLDSTKHQYIRRNDGLKPIAVNGRYILLRRFISKDSRSRLIGAVMPENLLKYEYIGIENHLNILHQNWKDIESTLRVGLCGILNSNAISRIFHLISGTTQVNAYDLQLLPLPDKETIVRIGNLIDSDEQIHDSMSSIDAIVNDCLLNSQ